MNGGRALESKLAAFTAAEDGTAGVVVTVEEVDEEVGEGGLLLPSMLNRSSHLYPGVPSWVWGG